MVKKPYLFNNNSAYWTLGSTSKLIIAIRCKIFYIQFFTSNLCYRDI
jgi:hypothetical protein